jgi:hypothetical protein
MASNFRIKQFLFLQFFVLVFTGSIFSQGNLQYNQTRFIEITAIPSIHSASGYPGITIWYDSLVINVPTGKTLKIESASLGSSVTEIYGAPYNFQVTHPINTYYGGLYLNDKMICFANGTPMIVVQFPIWLSMGNYKLKIYGNTSSNSELKGFVSAIEFNIVP